MKQITMPELNEGEHYAGLILNEDGEATHHLILLPDAAKDITWDNAWKWAQAKGGDLPTRQEQSLLFANCKQHFERDWYWSNTQHAADSYDAWVRSSTMATSSTASRVGQVALAPSAD